MSTYECVPAGRACQVPAEGCTMMAAVVCHAAVLVQLCVVLFCVCTTQLVVVTTGALWALSAPLRHGCVLYVPVLPLV